MALNGYWVYTHTTPDGMVYVGYSGMRYAKARWNPKKYKGRFGKEIALFGWENIEHKVIRDGLTKNEALDLEEEIRKFNETNGVSLNLQRSGRVVEKIGGKKEYSKKWNRDNRERYNENSRKNYERHKEYYREKSRIEYIENIEKHKKYREEHKEQYAEYNKMWKKEHREEWNEYCRKYRLEHREELNKRNREYYHKHFEENKEKERLRSRIRYAKKKQEKQLKEIGYIPLF